MMKSMVKMVLTAWFAMSAAGTSASILSEWHETHSKEPTYVKVGSEKVKTKDAKDGYYFAGANAELKHTDYGWVLTLYGGTIVAKGSAIEADGNLAIKLDTGSFTNISPVENEKTKEAYGITTVNSAGVEGSYGVLIYGQGSLAINHFAEEGNGIRCGNLKIAGGSAVAIHTATQAAIYMRNGGGIEVVGATLETMGKVYGGNVVFDRAVVNVLSSGTGVSAWGDLTVSSTFGVFIAKTGNALSTRKALNLDNSIVYAMSKDASCVNVDYNTMGITSTIGRGLYKFATMGGAGKAAIEFDMPLTLNGGELVTCTPDGYGLHSSRQTLTVNSGLIRNKFSMDIAKEFFISSELLDVYGLVNSWATLAEEGEFAPQVAIEAFLGHTLINWLQSESIDNPSGLATSMTSFGEEPIILNGGTILSEHTEHGVCVGNLGHVKIYGGSLQGPIKHTSTLREKPQSDVDGNILVCVTNTVAAEPYSLVGSGWTAQLPLGYDTSSLYLDGQSKLYFWVPEEYAEQEPGPTPMPMPTYIITYSPGANGMGLRQTATKTKDVALTLEGEIFTRDGYTQTGWATSDGGEKVYDLGASYTANAAVTLYPVWTANTSDTFLYPDLLPYTPSGWSAPIVVVRSPSDTVDAMNITADDTLYVRRAYICRDALVPTTFYIRLYVDGEEFRRYCVGMSVDQWKSGDAYNIGKLLAGTHTIKMVVDCYDDVEESNEDNNTYTKTITVGRSANCTVTFNAYGGMVLTTKKIVENGAAVGSLPIPTRSGYVFDGWYTAARGGTRIDTTTRVTGNVTYYAHWTMRSAGQLNTTFGRAQTVVGALHRGGVLVGTVEMKFGKINAKRGIVKVSGTATLMDGGKAKKVLAKVVNMSLAGGAMSGTLAFKAPVGSMAFTLSSDGKFTLKNSSYEMVAADVGGTLSSGRHTFTLGEITFASGGDLQEQLLPKNETFSVSGGRWTFGKNATVRWARDRSTKEYALLVDTAKGKTNLSSLKLTYTPKTGLFKGSFKVYALTVSNGRTKLAKYTANVIGFVVDGVGYGQATIKRPAAGPWSVTVK